MYNGIITRIDCILANKVCQSSTYSKIGRDARVINTGIILLSNVRQAMNTGWTLEMLHETDCLIKKYE